ncbi:maleylpyruvate isomerase family mycothiol-dependent enzyme [Actinoplanes sp. NPDC051346]|uniref:maleylpyruvate isomerase family mycothiol-dependent enzyme n=1 Tax=Actinoplanes sp. NPDC051346 TaxID=3155048 RepID=UPI00341BD8C1
MDAEQRWHVIHQQRLAIGDLLDGLTPAQWESPSLCDAWRIRDVAAHLTTVSIPPSPGSLFVDLIRARGSFHQLNTLATGRRAARPTAQIVADLRAHAASRKVPVVSNDRNVLFDLLVHGQDIAIPLGIQLPMPLEAAADGASRIWSMGWPFWAKRHLRGTRLTATDTEWSVGSGADIRGPIRALLLLLTGRTSAAAPLLSGEGVRRATGHSTT